LDRHDLSLDTITIIIYYSLYSVHQNYTAAGSAFGCMVQGTESMCTGMDCGLGWTSAIGHQRTTPLQGYGLRQP